MPSAETLSMAEFPRLQVDVLGHAFALLPLALCKPLRRRIALISRHATTWSPLMY